MYPDRTVKQAVVSGFGIGRAGQTGAIADVTEKIGGAALDVYEPRLPFDDEVTNRLVKNERVIATPHSIGQSVEAMEEKGRGVVKIIRDYVNGNSN